MLDNYNMGLIYTDPGSETHLFGQGDRYPTDVFGGV